MSALPPTAALSRRGSFAEDGSNKRTRGAQDDSVTSPRAQEAASPSAGSPEAQLAALQQQFLALFQRTQEQQAQQQAQAHQLQEAVKQIAAHQQQQLAHPPPLPAAHQPLQSALPLGADALAGQLALAMAAHQPLTLQPFGGEGNTAGIQAHNWLRDTELVFAERLAAVGPALFTDARRVAAASAALRGAAANWYSTLAAKPLNSWADFKAALLNRFQPRNAALLVEKQLEAFVAAAERGRERHTARTLEEYTAKFLEYAGQLPDTMLPPRARMRMYGRGLPIRGRELIAKADREALAPVGAKPIDLNAVIDQVLQRTAEREAIGGALAASGDAMDLSHVALDQVRHEFGVSAELAQQLYLADAEGWSERDTSGTVTAAQGSSSYTSANDTVALAAAVNALRVDVAALSRDRISPPVKSAVPASLREARIAAGICVKCGVTPYSRGRQGHNASTCQLPVNLTKLPSASSAAKSKQDFQ